ncbi:hypothetical protein WDJ51_13350 [Rathayibacter sp. YIM 133350]|uniref:hypothetical protein n=1 Tax=Rathayibacter sp. YIM 133350 TaxID=3131992 RepID=UPI00307D2BFC
MQPGAGQEGDGAADPRPTDAPGMEAVGSDARLTETATASQPGTEQHVVPRTLPPLVRAYAGDPDVAPTAVPATSPFGITVPVPIISDRELGLSHPGAHVAGAPVRLGAVVSGAVPLEAAAPQPTTTPLIAIALWCGVAVLLLTALVSAIGSLNRDVYSPSGFVREYLTALEERNADVALSFPGVDLTKAQLAEAGLPTDAARTLLRSSVLRAPKNLEFVSDTADAKGVRTVVYRATLGTQRDEVSFRVERNGSWAGVFHSWRFATSPLGAVSVTVLHDSSFSVNGLTLDARVQEAPDAQAGFSHSARYLVLTPNLYTFSRRSPLLEAAAKPVPLAQSGTTEVSIDVQPTATFVSEVQTQINTYLTDCAKQQVLQPTGCPFGTVIDDRLTSPPAWSIVEDPVVSLVADESAFQMPPADGTAHVSVGVQSLFDGDESTIERDESFTMAATVTIGSDNALNIQLH